MEPEQPQPPEPPAELLPDLEPLEVHIAALRAQLEAHQRIVLIASAAVLVGALAVLLAAGRPKVAPR